MTFYPELQLNQAGSKNLLRKTETWKEKSYPIPAIFGKDSCYHGMYLFFICYYFHYLICEMIIVLPGVELVSSPARHIRRRITGTTPDNLRCYWLCSLAVMTAGPRLTDRLSPVVGML